MRWYVLGIMVVAPMALVSGCLEEIADLYTSGSDPKPVYQAPLYSFQLSEGSPSGTAVGRIVVVNSDESKIVGWHFKEGDDAHHFSIAEDGTLRSVEALDFETRRFYTLIAQATNEHERSTDIAVHVELDDIDEGPQFSQESYLFEVSELNGLDDIGLVKARDPDIFLDLPDGPGIDSYAIAEGNDEEHFHIDEHGTISLLKELNFEIQDSYPLVVEAEDRSHITTRVAVTISVINIDEFSPMFGQESYAFGVREDAVRGTVVGRVSAVDPDLRGIESYRIVEGNFIRAGNSVPDLIIDIEGRIVVDVPLDYESLQSYHLRVRARDDDGSETTTNSIVMTDAEVTIDVINLDDERPQFLEPSYRFDIAENEGIGTLVGTVLAFDPDFPDDGNAIGYSIVGDTTHPALSFDANTGELMVVNDALLDYEMQQAAEEPLLRFTVMAEDGSGMSSTAEVGITVGDIVVRGEAASIAENVPIDTLVDIALSGPGGATYSIDDITGIIFNNVVDRNGNRVSITDIVTGTIEYRRDSLRIARALDYDSAARYELILNTVADSSEGELGVEDVEVTLQLIDRVTGGVAITDVSGGRDDGEIDFAWINPDGATFEEVAVSWLPVEGESQPIVIDTDAGEPNSLTLVGLTPGRTYTIVLTAVYDGGARIPVSTAQAAADFIPDPIASLVGIAGDGQVRLNWVNPAINDLMRLNVSVEEVGGGAPIVSQESRQTAADAPVTRIVTGLTNGANYRIGVTAIDTAGNPSGEQVRWITPRPSAPDWSALPGRLFRQRLHMWGGTLGGPIQSIAFNPDGSLLAAGFLNYGIALMTRIDDYTHGLYFRGGGITDALSVAFSPDGQKIVWSESNGAININRVPDLIQLNVWRVGSGTTSVYSVATSPDGRRFVSGAHDHRVRIHNIDDGRVVRTLSGHTAPVRSVAFNPDGHRLASASDDRTVRLWRASDGRLLKTLTGHSGEVRSVAFSPDGHQLASASDDSTVRIWRTSSGALLHTLSGLSGLVSSVAFSPDGGAIASGDERDVTFWNATTGDLIAVINNNTQNITSVAFSSDGQMFAFGEDKYNGDIGVWQSAETLTGHGAGVKAVAVSPDGSLIASASIDNSITIWNASDNRPIRTLTGHGAFDVNAVAFSPDGATLASGSQDDTIKLWRVATGREFRTLRGHTNDVWSVAFSPDGELVASGSRDRSIRFWRVRDGSLLYALTNAHTNDVETVAFSPDGQILASGGRGIGVIKLWNVADGRPHRIHALSGHRDTVSSLAFSPDGATIASGSWDTTLRIWRVADGAPLHLFQGHTDAVLSLAFAHQGSTVASGSRDNYIRLWQVGAGTPLLATLFGHSDAVESLVFSPDGRTLVSGSRDSSVKIWKW